MIYPITATVGSGMMFKTDAEARVLALSLVRHEDCNGEVSYLPPSDCTPPAKNDDACRVPLAAESGLGVCALPLDVQASLDTFRINHEAYECVAALYIRGLVPVRAVTLIQSALEERVKLVVNCGYLPFMH